MHKRYFIAIILLFFSILETIGQNILIDDFENGYSKWVFKGDNDAFGIFPVEGNSRCQANITGYGEKWLVNSAYYSGNAPIGKMILKKPILINRRYLVAAIGGGFNRKNIYLRVIDTEGNELGRLTGRNSELLRKKSIDLDQFRGRYAYIEIVDDWDNPWWGHINVDDIYLTESHDSDVIITTVEVEINHRYLTLPVSNKSNDNKLFEVIDISSEIHDRLFYQEVIPLDFINPDWVAVLPVDSLIGSRVRLIIEHNKNESPKIGQSDTIPYHSGYPDELYRPQYFYTAGQGYLNDPNGLVYWKGNWHLFYQYTPTSIEARKKSWGHAVSTDLMTWKELPPAINAFYEEGKEHNIFSGTGFVDNENRSGLFRTEDGGVIFSFTCTGKGEYLAYAEDEYLTDIRIMKHNPIITQNGRDPRIFFNGETKSWVILRYDEIENDSLIVRERGKLENVRKLFSFYKSENLVDWEYLSSIENFYECPDIFSIKLQTEEKQIVMDATGKYLIGNFDGNRFISDEKPKDPVFWGNFYATQHFENAPDNRIVVVGWIGQDIEKMKEHDMSFSQAISIPMDMILRKDSTNDLYLAALPSKEVYNKIKDTIYERSFLEPTDKNIMIDEVPTSAFIDIDLLWDKGEYAEFSIGEVTISFDKSKNELSISHGKKSPREVYKIERPNNDKLKLQIFIDRSTMGIFYDTGQTVIFSNHFFGKENIKVGITAKETIIKQVNVNTIKSRYNL